MSRQWRPDLGSSLLEQSSRRTAARLMVDRSGGLLTFNKASDRTNRGSRDPHPHSVILSLEMSTAAYQQGCLFTRRVGP